ncbi:MAG: enoyl-CoA hydratase/isomerase family protein [Actinobacteria bacterium]|nr:enoyl-CoA hydratase/isomerase family protein [Actinomycetota bacterium]MBU1943482.1 enoyl-CoA hydratase/isomerase family protein [Actinomycetota bacterium]MBU2686839.1 enoyl-CoA hydratase/isomerase family protein [Actinomycetota bacterium]
MDYETIIYERSETRATIRLNRPEAMNGINGQVVEEVRYALADAAAEPLLRALVLAGSEKAFCVGADLKFVLGELMGDGSLKDGFLADVKRMLDSIEGFPAPVIGAVSGMALAGGLELLLCCDLIVAAESAVFGDAHSNYGLIPGGGATVRMPLRIGASRAKLLMYLGDSHGAAEMERWGLVDVLAPDGELESTVDGIVTRLEEKSPLVLRTMKSLVNGAGATPKEESLWKEIEALDAHRRSGDMREGLLAFKEKRVPVFHGK